MDADKEISAPSVRRSDARSQTFRLRAAEGGLGCRSGQKHLKIPVSTQKFCRLYPHRIIHILFPYAVSLRPRVGIGRIMSLVKVYLDCHTDHRPFPNRHHVIWASRSTRRNALPSSYIMYCMQKHARCASAKKKSENTQIPIFLLTNSAHRRIIKMWFFCFSLAEQARQNRK